MQRQFLLRLTGVIILVIYFLHVLWSWFMPVLKTILLDIAPYTLSQKELAVAGSPSGDDGASTIPKIIHQVYLGFDNKAMPPEWAQARQSCIELNPTYEHKLWSNETVVDLLRTEYPWFVETWMNYPYNIQRADSIRYFILARHGGIYLDLDNGCRRNLDPLLPFEAWMPATEIEVGLTNHVMGTKKGHPYFHMLLDSIDGYDHNYIFPYLTIMNSAGPHFVSLVWEKYLRTNASTDEVRILLQEEYRNNEWSFFTKVKGGSWYHWDVSAFAWAGHHLLPVTAVVLCCLGALTYGLSWAGWRIAARTRARDVEDVAQSSVPMVWQKSD